VANGFQVQVHMVPKKAAGTSRGHDGRCSMDDFAVWLPLRIGLGLSTDRRGTAQYRIRDIGVGHPKHLRSRSIRVSFICARLAACYFSASAMRVYPRGNSLFWTRLSNMPW
jgi:hypothetical protein